MRAKPREEGNPHCFFLLSAPGGALGPLTASSAAPLSTSPANPLAPCAAPAAIVSTPRAAASAGCVSGSRGKGPRASWEEAAAKPPSLLSSTSLLDAARGVFCRRGGGVGGGVDDDAAA